MKWPKKSTCVLAINEIDYAFIEGKNSTKTRRCTLRDKQRFFMKTGLTFIPNAV